MSRPALVEHTKNKRVRKIINGFLCDTKEKTYFGTPRFRLLGSKPDPLVINQANRSGRRNGSPLKKLFLVGQYRWCEKYISKQPVSDIVVWNGLKGRRSLMPHAAHNAQREVYYFEEAPLNGRIAIDRQGINFGSSLPRDPDFYVTWAEDTSTSASDWRYLLSQLVSRSSDSQNGVDQRKPAADLSKENYIFCPLQVPGDSQITVYGDWIETVEAAIDTLAQASRSLPDGWHLKIKEHPSAPYSLSERLCGLKTAKFRVDNQTDTMAQVMHSKAVVTVNSSVGLHALMHDKPTLVLGQAFYAMPGLAKKVTSAQDLNTHLNSPDSLKLDLSLRDCFLNYLDKEYFPEEEAVCNGTFTRQQVLERDARRDIILKSLNLSVESRKFTGLS